MRRLIAAAPDMLNALQVAIMWSDPDWVGHEIVTAAVAKAVGHNAELCGGPSGPSERAPG